MQPSEFSGISGLLGKAAGSPGDAGSLRQRERSGPSASGSNSPRLAQTPPGPAASSKKPVHSPSLWPFIYSSSNHPVSRAALEPDVRFARESQEPRVTEVQETFKLCLFQADKRAPCQILGNQQRSECLGYDPSYTAFQWGT